MLAGPFVYGAKLRQEFGSRSLGRVMEILDPAARHRELLAAQAVDPLHGAEHRGMLADRRLEQIEAFRQGCGGLIPDVGTD